MLPEDCYATVACAWFNMCDVILVRYRNATHCVSIRYLTTVTHTCCNIPAASKADLIKGIQTATCHSGKIHSTRPTAADTAVAAAANRVSKRPVTDISQVVGHLDETAKV